jgi:WD40 repeat protein
LRDGEYGLASAGNDEKIFLWNAAGDSAGELWGGHRTSVAALATVRTARGQRLLASAGDDPKVILWDPVSLSPITHLYDSGSGSFSSLCVLSGQNGEVRLAAGTRDGRVGIWDTAVNQAQFATVLHVSDAEVLAVANMKLPTGRELLVAASGDGCVRFWDAIDGGLQRTVPLPFDQQVRNLLTFGTTLVLQTDTALIVSDIDPALAVLPALSGYS